MSTGWGRRLQAAAACLLVVAYASLAHFSNSHGPSMLGATLALAPVTLIAIAVVWRWTTPLRAALLTLALLAGLYELFPVFEHQFSRFYLVQESSIYTLLGLTFSRSLASGRTALCTRFADKLHGPLSPREVLYTRRVTLAWALFFFAVAGLSVLLYAMAPLRVWSIYINFCVLPLIAVMFVAEFAVRRRVLPQVARVGILDGVRVYFASPH